MPGHWTGSVFLSVLVIAAVFTSARAVWRSAWREAACWGTAAAGMICLVAQNAGLVDLALPSVLLLGLFLLQRLSLWRTDRTAGARQHPSDTTQPRPGKVG
ncbi:hypothetical protein ACFYOG_16840 [Streptomyces sp. NPDC007818]|uniref:hypothetical protein n=1 Tax=Streptomyces sp. NPDC007818 TaxID=3364780 RepID=UPI0036A73BA9